MTVTQQLTQSRDFRQNYLCDFHLWNLSAWKQMLLSCWLISEKICNSTFKTKHEIWIWKVGWTRGYHNIVSTKGKTKMEEKSQILIITVNEGKRLEKAHSYPPTHCSCRGRPYWPPPCKLLCSYSDSCSCSRCHLARCNNRQQLLGLYWQSNGAVTSIISLIPGREASKEYELC